MKENSKEWTFVENKFTTNYNEFNLKLVHRFVNNYTNRAGCGFECADKKTQA